MADPGCCEVGSDERLYRCEVVRLLECLVGIEGGEILQSEVLCDDTLGDGTAIVPFRRLVTVDITVAPPVVTIIGDFTIDYSAPYVVVGPNPPELCPESLCAEPTGVTVCYEDPDGGAPQTQQEVYTSANVFQITLPPVWAQTVQVKAWGAGGGAGFSGTSTGGGGAFRSTTFAAQPLLVFAGEGGPQGLVTSPPAASFNAGRAGISLASAGGGGGGLSGVYSLPGILPLLVAGSGGGAGGSAVANAPGGAGGVNIGGTGGSGTTGVGGTGGITLGSGESENGIGGVIIGGGDPADGETGASNFFQAFGGMGGDEAAGATGSGGGGGAGWASGGGGSGATLSVPSNAGGGGGGNSFVDPAGIGGAGFTGSGATPGNPGDPDYVAGSGVGGSASAGGNGLVVLTWIGATGKRKASQYALCDENGDSIYEWRDSETGAVLPGFDPETDSLPCESVCPVDNAALTYLLSLQIDNPGSQFTINIDSLSTSDASTAVQIFYTARDVQSNGWGAPPAGPIPSYPAEYVDGTVAGLPWDPDGINESYYVAITYVWGSDAQYQCVVRIYVPQFEATSDTDYSGFRFSTDGGPWFAFNVSGDTLGAENVGCYEPVVNKLVQEVRVCNQINPFQFIKLCDDNPPFVTAFLRRYTSSGDILFSGSVDYNLDGVSPYVVQGNVRCCEYMFNEAVDVAVVADLPLVAATDSVASVASTGRVFDGSTERTVLFHTQNVAVAGDTTLIPAVGGLRIRVLGIHVHSLENVDVFFRSGLAGAVISGTNPIRARGGYVLNTSEFGWFQTAGATPLVVNQSLAVAVGYTIVYITT